jgi:hypothetical protein
MKRVLIALISLFSLSHALADTAISGELRAATLEHGRTLATAFFAGNLEPVWNACDEEGKAQFSNLEGLQRYRSEQAVFGKETKLLKEDVSLDGDTTYYTRTVKLEQPEADYQLWIGFNDAGRVTKLVLKPAGDEGDVPTGNKG